VWTAMSSGANGARRARPPRPCPPSPAVEAPELTKFCDELSTPPAVYME
jgi:hypothetical protein